MASHILPEFNCFIDLCLVSKKRQEEKLFCRYMIETRSLAEIQVIVNESNCTYSLLLTPGRQTLKLLIRNPHVRLGRWLSDYTLAM